MVPRQGDARHNSATVGISHDPSSYQLDGGQAVQVVATLAQPMSVILIQGNNRMRNQNHYRMVI
jgi:hypothetical protein